MTKLNQELLDMIQHSKGHLTAEEVFFLAKENNLSVSMASTYRILSKLHQEGYLAKVTMPGQPDIFDKTITKHGHKLCRVCGQLEDLEIKELDSIISSHIKDYDSYELMVHHTCDKCKRIRN